MLVWLTVAMLITGEAISGTVYSVVRSKQQRGESPARILLAVFVLVGGETLFAVAILYALGIR